MQDLFVFGKQTRSNFIGLVEGLDLTQLQTKLPGFNNNILWNFAHSVVTLDLLVYGLAGLDFELPQELIDKYRKGSSPQDKVSPEEWQQILEAGKNAYERLEQRYATGEFQQFKPYPTSYGVQLNSAEEAIRFCAVHEGLHLGYAMAQRRALN